MSETYEFADFRLDIRERTLTRSGGERVALPDKAFDTLCVLVRNAGKLVGKEELLKSVWTGSFVEENNLNKSAHAIRKALGDQNGEPKFVETVKKHGFRFIADVTKAEPEVPHPNPGFEGNGYDEAFRQMDRIADLNPGNAFRLYWQNAGALITAEPSSQAYDRWLRYLRPANPKLVQTDEQTIQLYESIYQTSGWQGVMREQAKRNKENPIEHQFLIAAIHAQIGDKDTAMEFLERSYARREFWMAHLRVEPRLDSLRGDPRFEDLVRRVESK